MAKPVSGLARQTRKVPAAPKQLEQPERNLWRRFLELYRMDDAPSLALLTTTLEAHQRARRCREAVDREGETILDRFKQVKIHPLLAAERDARASFLAGMRILRLDIGDGS